VCAERCKAALRWCESAQRPVGKRSSKSVSPDRNRSIALQRLRVHVHGDNRAASRCWRQEHNANSAGRILDTEVRLTPTQCCRLCQRHAEHVFPGARLQCELRCAVSWWCPRPSHKHHFCAAQHEHASAVEALPLSVQQHTNCNLVSIAARQCHSCHGVTLSDAATASAIKISGAVRG
jgi:hypothetical protein